MILRCKMTLTTYTSINNHTYRIGLYGVINMAGLCVSALGQYRFQQVHFIRSKFIVLFIKKTSFQNLTLDHVQIKPTIHTVLFFKYIYLTDQVFIYCLFSRMICYSQNLRDETILEGTQVQKTKSYIVKGQSAASSSGFIRFRI